MQDQTLNKVQMFFKITLRKKNKLLRSAPLT